MILNLLVLLSFLRRGVFSASQWSEYTTQNYGNERHDGFLGLPPHSNFLPAINNSAPAWSMRFNSTYTCYSSAQALLVKTKIYCASGTNKVNAFDVNTGDLLWSYLVIGATNLQSLTYVDGVEKSSEGGVIVVPDAASFVVLDAATGNFMTAKAISTSEQRLSGILAGTQNGIVVGVASGYPSSTINVYVYDINKNSVMRGSGYSTPGYYIGGPTLCGEMENITIISDGCGGTTAFGPSTFSPTTLTQIWRYSVSCTNTGGIVPPPLCYKSQESGKYHVITSSIPGRLCNEFEANGNGTILNSFPCMSPPLIHYDADGTADFAVLATGSVNQIVVTQIVGNSVIAKELWIGSGATLRSFVIGDYYVTKDSGSALKVYQIQSGKVMSRVSVDYYYSGGLLVGEASRKNYTIVLMGSQGMQAYQF